MTSAEFWKSPIPRPKPSIKPNNRFKKQKEELPAPIKESTELRDGREFKVTVLPGFSGKPAAIAESKVQRIGAKKITISRNGVVSLLDNNSSE
jgi:hypothetical protein